MRSPILGLTVLLSLASILSGCSPQREDQLAEIRAIHARGELVQVVAALGDLLEQEPDHAEANFILGQVLLQTARPGLAIAALEKAARDPRFARSAGLLRTSTLFETRAYDEAVAAADEILEADPDNMLALLTRGRSQLARGQGDAALADAERILEIEADHQNATLLKGNALVELGRRDDAERVWINRHTQLSAAGRIPLAAQACTQLALFYRSQREIDAADRTYQKCLDAYPTDAYLQRFASDFYMQRGQPERAVELYRRAVEVSPDDLRYWARLAHMLSVFGEPDEAQATLERAIERFQSPESWRLLADFHLQRSETEKARAALEEAIRISREPHQPLIFSLADLLAGDGDLEGARRVGEGLTEPSYQHLLEGVIRLENDDPERALDELDAALAMWPQNARARFLAGEAALRSGDPARAASEYAIALQISRQATDAALRLAEIEFAAGRPRSALNYARRHILRRPYVDATPYQIGVRSSLAIGDIESATHFANALEKVDPMSPIWVIENAAIQRVQTGPGAAIESILASGRDLEDPENASLLRTFVQDLRLAGRAGEGLGHLDRAIARDEDRADLHDLRARILLRLERVEDTSAAIDRALAIDPNYAPALESRAMLALAMGDSNAALNSLEAASRAEPGTAEYLHAAAMIAKEEGDETRTIGYLDRALERQPGHAASANDLAWILASSGQDLDRALSLARLAVQRSSTTGSLETLGWVRHQRGEFRHAISSFRSALERNPDLPAIRYRLGLALAASGERQQARELLQQLVAGPPFPEIDAARAELDRLDDS
jgi:tetratricopeptide (TPR) repeat protein